MNVLYGTVGMGPREEQLRRFGFVPSCRCLGVTVMVCGDWKVIHMYDRNKDVRKYDRLPSANKPSSQSYF